MLVCVSYSVYDTALTSQLYSRVKSLESSHRRVYSPPLSSRLFFVNKPVSCSLFYHITSNCDSYQLCTHPAKNTAWTGRVGVGPSPPPRHHATALPIGAQRRRRTHGGLRCPSAAPLSRPWTELTCLTLHACLRRLNTAYRSHDRSAFQDSGFRPSPLPSDTTNPRGCRTCRNT